MALSHKQLFCYLKHILRQRRSKSSMWRDTGVGLMAEVRIFDWPSMRQGLKPAFAAALRYLPHSRQS